MRLLRREEPQERLYDKVTAHVPTREDVAAEVERLRPSFGPLPPLARYVAHPRCPKCRSAAVTISYAASGGHVGCPDMDYDTTSERFLYSVTATASDVATGQLLRERRVEHHDRRCVNCGFAWVMAIAEPGQREMTEV